MKRAYTLPVNETTRLPLSYTFILFYSLQLFPCRACVYVCVCVCHRCVYIADVRTVDTCVDVPCSYVCCKCVSSFVISLFSHHVDSFSLSLFIFLSSRDLNNVRDREGKFVSFFFLIVFYLVDMSPFIIIFFSYFFPSFLGDASSGDAEFPLASEHCRSFSFSLSFWYSLLLSSV